ncbi:MAG: class I SAM-dependent methyltransferase [Anaerolineae bacterium]|nr:class I SAM-dependent methyltransferase [Anaerolineae bacterium]
MARHDVVQEAFTELAPHYEEAMDHELGSFLGLSYMEFVETLLQAPAVKEGGLILDVATGTALIPRRLVDKVRGLTRVVGLDITPAMLQEAQARLPSRDSSSAISLVCASGMDMPFAHAVFDLVVCGFGTHHMELSRMLSEMRRVLKRGGNLVLVDAGMPTWWRSMWARVLLKAGLLVYRLGHRNARAQAEVAAFASVRTAGEWHTLLVHAGFVDVDIAESHTRRSWYPHALTMRAVAGAGSDL